MKCKPSTIQTANKIHAEGATALADALKINTSLTSLDLFGVVKKEQPSDTQLNKQTTKTTKTENKIQAEGAIALARALKESKTLTELDLTGEQQQHSINIKRMKQSKMTNR